MRRSLMLVPLLFACAKSDAPPANTPPAPAMAMAAATTEADVAGTWSGDSKMPGSDSILGKWTQICGGGTCKGIFEGQKDTVTSSYMLMGDSVMGSVPAHMDLTGKIKITEAWVVHIKGGSATGHGEMHLADKPDSIVGKYVISGTKKM